jgi:hypothetical protein
VTKTFKHQKTQGLGALLEEESGRKKECFGRHLKEEREERRRF